MRLFIFFNQAGQPQFVRDDAETASWTVEEMSMVATFPYNPDKVLERGMRVGFEDALNILQPFEIRKVETLEPDHYQRITCEHIVISELTDCHMQEQELTNVTAQAALSGILAGTGWSVGTVMASVTSSGDLAIGSVWQNVRTIEQNWNVYITPRVTFNNSGITGKFLDISPAQGTWSGIYLSLDRNADEIGVVIDDTDVKTALYGYGAATDNVPLTFGSVIWGATSEHPAKPSGQTFIEDPDATAAYGRNGTARFGFYQNTDITDPNVLLQKTWEVLKTTNAPKVTVNCMVRDLYRLGYNDQPIRLHDTARVEIRDTGTKLELEIIQLIVDLLDPTATRPTIGAYRPNIVYIQRQTAMNAAGGASNTSSGRRGGGGGKGTALDEKLKEFETKFVWNDYQIGLRAYQRDLEDESGRLLKAYAAIGVSSDTVESIVAGSGVMLDEYGNIVVDEHGYPIFTNGAEPIFSRVTQTAEQLESLYYKSGVNALGSNETLFSRITQNAEQIQSEVARASAAEGVMSSRITQTADAITMEVARATESEGNLSSRITQEANKIALVVSGDNVNAASIVAAINNAGSSVTIKADKIDIDGWLKANYATVAGLYSQNDVWAASTVSAPRILAGGHDVSGAIASIGPATASGGQITIPISYLNGSSGTAVNFNIADTQYYKDGVSAAWTNAANTARINNSVSGVGNSSITLSSGESVTVWAQVKANSSASIFTTVGTVTVSASGGGSSDFQLGTVKTRNANAIGATVYVNYYLNGSWHSESKVVQQE